MTRHDILAGTIAACAPIAHHFPRRPGGVGGGTLHHIVTAGSDPMRDECGEHVGMPEFSALEAARLVQRTVRSAIASHRVAELGYDVGDRLADVAAWEEAERSLGKHVDAVEWRIIGGLAKDWIIPPYARVERGWQQAR